MIASIINTTGATIVIGAESFNIRRDHVSYPSIIQELNGGRDPAKLKALLDVRNAVSQLTQGKIEVKDDKLFFNGEVLNTGLTTRILTLIKDNQNGIAGPLLAFLENLMNNPSRRAVQGLYDWLEKSDLPITDDGCFIAWKIVGPDFKDLHSRTFDNSPGQRVQIERNQVDEDPNRTCSYGLHFCSSGYLPHYGTSAGNKVVMVKVNPADVVAFPNDYNTAKGRCAGYDVIKEVVRDAAPTMFANKETAVYRTPTTADDVVNMYVNQRGALTFTLKDGTDVVTRVPALSDYDFIAVDGKLKLTPSGRRVNLP